MHCLFGHYQLRIARFARRFGQWRTVPWTYSVPRQLRTETSSPANLHGRQPQMNLRLPIIGLALVLLSATGAAAQTSAADELIQLSKNKWQWMAAKDVAKLEPLFHERSKVVHIGGTWKKAEELDIIQDGTHLVQASGCP
jgi:hypothetical protein